MTLLMLELLGFLLAALLIGWWCGSRFFRWRLKRLTVKSEIQAKALEETVQRLRRELESSIEHADNASAARDVAETRVVEIDALRAAKDEALTSAQSQIENLQGELIRERRKINLLEQALGALQTQHDKSVNSLETLKTEAEAHRSEDEGRRKELERLQRERESLQEEARNSLRRLKELETDVLAILNKAGDLQSTGPVD